MIKHRNGMPMSSTRAYAFTSSMRVGSWHKIPVSRGRNRFPSTATAKPKITTVNMDTENRRLALSLSWSAIVLEARRLPPIPSIQ